MSDARTPSGNPKLASEIYNAYPLNPRTARDIIGRPGANHLATVASPGLGQAAFQYRKLDGTTYTVVFINGLMYTVNWATGVHTNVALGAIGALQTTDKIYMTVLADKLIISDGVRKPFYWDGAVFTDMTNCPVLFGQPVVYYAKLFGIVKANPVQIVWSEENAPLDGYDTQINPATLAPYDNQWVVGQTAQDRLYVLMATDDALYFSRARSWSMITGPAEDDFRSTGNREAVSSTVGCTLPSSCIFRNGEIWFQDRDGFFWYIPLGGQPVPLWEGYRETIMASDKDPPATAGGRANLCSMVDWPLVPLVMATIAVINTDAGGPWPWRFRILTWNPETKVPQGVWDLPSTVEPVHMAAVTNLGELDRVIMLLDENGHSMVFGTPQAGPWRDQIYSGNVAITHRVKGAELGWEITQDKDWESITALFYGSNLSATTTIGYTTPMRTASVPQTVQAAALAADAEIRRKVGIKQLGRWLRPEVTHSLINEQFRFLGFEAGAFAIANPPRIK
jgi:hypothetical protein